MRPAPAQVTLNEVKGGMPRRMPRDQSQDFERELDFLRRDDDFFFGTLAPFFRASERPMAIACSRLVTLPP